MEDRIKELTDELLIGAYDLYVHTSPSVFPREQDGFQLIREADAAGMAGVMLKSHYESTALRASLINQYSGCKAKAYGGLALNWPVGGLNIYAVSNALRAGAKIIWMPTRDSANSLCYGDMEGDFFSRKGITLQKEDGSLKDEVYEIMDAVKHSGAALATGHDPDAPGISADISGARSPVGVGQAWRPRREKLVEYYARPRYSGSDGRNHTSAGSWSGIYSYGSRAKGPPHSGFRVPPVCLCTFAGGTDKRRIDECHPRCAASHCGRRITVNERNRKKVC